MAVNNLFRSLMLTFVLSIGGLLPLQGATTTYVGGCGNPSQTTIQAAVTASSPGGTVLICPGTYKEQVTINKNLTVAGVPVANRDQVVITSPSAGVTANTTDFSMPVAAQILVQNANVTLVNITVDGSGNNINGCAPDLRGIYYQNAGGSISDVATRFQVLAPALIGCQSGEAIFAESGYTSSTKRTVNIRNNSVHDFQKNGITADGPTLTANISGNYIVGQGPTTGAAENGVQVSDGAAGKVLNNTTIDEIYAPDTSSDTGDAASGILIYASENIEIAGNTVGSTQYGIVTVSSSASPTSANPSGLADHANIHDNRILGTRIFDGIDVCSSNNEVYRNTVYSSTEAAIHLDSTCGSTGTNNTVSDNVVNEACAAILQGATPNTIGGPSGTDNTFFNVASQILAGDVCPAAGSTSSSSTAAALTAFSSPIRQRSRPAPVR